MMSGTDEYAESILDKFSSLPEVSSRRMFGGHVFHMAGKVLGFVFEDRFLFEPGPMIDRLMPDAPRRELFPGSKLFVEIDESISPMRLCELAQACYDDLPVSKPRRKKNQSQQEKKHQEAVESQFPWARHFKD